MIKFIQIRRYNQTNNFSQTVWTEDFQTGSGYTNWDLNKFQIPIFPAVWTEDFQTGSGYPN